MPKKQPLTIIVVPETGRRTLTVRLARTWLIVPGLLAVATVSALTFQYQQNKALKQHLAELNDLRRVNRVQQAEIESMAGKTAETSQKLAELQGLQRDILDLTNPGAPSRSGATALESTEPPVIRSRGDSQPEPSAPVSLPTLAAMLPPDVGAYLFAKRDTQPLHIRQPNFNTRQPDAMLTTADRANVDLDAQIGDMSRLFDGLTRGKKAIEERLDYLAHRPTGYPVSGAMITDRFGLRSNPFGWGTETHAGIDLAAGYGAPVYATGDGVVTMAGWKTGGLGIMVALDHGYGFSTRFAHLSDTKVQYGDTVKRGQLIGWLGNTGHSTGPHVHYEVHVNGVPVDPIKYLY